MPEYRTILSRSETGVARATTAIALAATLAGCAMQGGHQAAMKSEPTFMRLTEERVFAQALRQRYLELAMNAYDRGDFNRSDFYSMRSIMAVEGKLVDPAGAGQGGGGALNGARAHLDRVFSRGARTGSPDLAARAQAAYDCWWLESRPGGDEAIAAACEYNAKNAFAELDAVGTGSRLAAASSAPQQYVINNQTPSQTVNAGGSTIEVINTGAAPAPRVAPQAPRHQDRVVPTYPISPAPLAPVPAPEQAYTPPPQAIAPMQPIQSEAASARTFVIEAAEGYEYGDFNPMRPDTIVPTVPIQDPMAPIDLISDHAAGVSYGGQYVTVEPEQGVIPTRPIYDEPAFAPASTYVPTVPVYDTAAAAPQTVNTVMMEQSGDMLSTLVEARNSGRSDFSVYFGFDSDEITPEGEDVLRDTVEQIKLEDRGEVSLIGFTDSAGDSRYNQLLAMRRTNAVRGYIQRNTGRPVRFEVMPVGEAEAVRESGDGVTKALNRRVEIILR